MVESHPLPAFSAVSACTRPLASLSPVAFLPVRLALRLPLSEAECPMAVVSALGEQAEY
jgi:hypothetical protein